MANRWSKSGVLREEGIQCFKHKGVEAQPRAPATAAVDVAMACAILLIKYAITSLLTIANYIAINRLI